MIHLVRIIIHGLSTVLLEMMRHFPQQMIHFFLLVRCDGVQSRVVRELFWYNGFQLYLNQQGQRSNRCHYGFSTCALEKHCHFNLF